jgi:hypothetical protein
MALERRTRRKTGAGGEAEALDALNARVGRKLRQRDLIEATIEEKAKKKRSTEGALSSKLKPRT